MQVMSVWGRRSYKRKERCSLEDLQLGLTITNIMGIAHPTSGKQNCPELMRMGSRVEEIEVESGRQGRGRGKWETVQTAWPPSCLCASFARAPFSRTHASPCPPRCLSLCSARLRRSARAAPALPGLPEEAFVEMSTEGGFGGTSSSDAQQSLKSFWPRVMEEIWNLAVKNFRVQELPLARIKIMKLDEDVKMISAEAPVLFARAAQIFITELTLRAWIHTEDNKCQTLQRNDIAMAITKCDQFDFLIDIVLRDELKPPKCQEEVLQSVTPAEPVQYCFTLAQQPTALQVQGQQQGQTTASSMTTIQPGQIIIAQLQQGQTTPVTTQVGEGQQMPIVQVQPQGQTQ
ncbi:nuclear transcription factor Y subunit gamma-like [Pongo pygmaeus]|uniref:nuclear transcription factor Y subunit gamma-like n=1 Tax=Pongo pygmaeus TaxID=9600 RepID=UPI0023E2FE1A|nr:nuclear transcription factor Y subunit gamma-like [Pongo pygmaeus]